MFFDLPVYFVNILFSGFYLALLLLLIALILRGVAFEFRSKDDRPEWRARWDWAIFIGSLLPALLLGVAFANLVRGVPIDADMNYVGSFFTLLNPYALLGGIALVLVCTFHGAIFLSMKTTGAVLERAQRAASRLWLPVVLVLLVFMVATYMVTDILARLGIVRNVQPFKPLVKPVRIVGGMIGFWTSTLKDFSIISIMN